MKKQTDIYQKIILGILSAVGPLAMDFFLPGLPMIQKEFGITTSLTQLTVTMSLIGIALGQIFLGPLADRIGRRRPLLMGMIVFALSSALIATTDNIYFFLLMRLIQGIAGSAGIVLSLTIITDLFAGKDLRSNITINQAINGLFPVIAPIFGALIMQAMSWRATFWGLALIGIFLFYSVWRYLPETLVKDETPVQKHSFINGYQQIFANRTFTRLVVIQALVIIPLFSYIAGSAFILQGMYHLSLTTYSIVYAFNGVGMIATTLISNQLSNYFKETSILVAFILYGLVGGGLLALTISIKSLGLLVVALFMIVSAVGALLNLGASLALQNLVGDKGTGSATLGVSRFLVGGLVSPLVGIMGSATIVPLVIIVLLSQGTALLLVLLHISKVKQQTA